MRAGAVIRSNTVVEGLRLPHNPVVAQYPTSHQCVYSQVYMCMIRENMRSLLKLGYTITKCI